jgi:hypothetical protein
MQQNKNHRHLQTQEHCRQKTKRFKDAPHAGVFGYDTKAAARSIEQHSVECDAQRRRLPSINACYDCIPDSHPLQVCSERLDAFFIRIV